MQFSKSILFTAAALIAPLAIQATPLTSLNLAPITTTDGSLTFSNFSCGTSFTGAGTYTGTCAGLNITALAGPDGITFQEGFNSSNGDLDILLDYTVTADKVPITSIGMLFNGFITPPVAGNGTVSVSEQAIWTGTINPDSQTVIVAETLGVNGVTNVDSGTVPLFTALGVGQSLTVDKNINLTASAGSTANLSYIDQTFATAAPEPGTTALMGGGLMMVGLLLRRRFNKQAA
jgi:hypothetical protein